MPEAYCEIAAASSGLKIKRAILRDTIECSWVSERHTMCLPNFFLGLC